MAGSVFDARPRLPRGFSCASRNCGLKREGRDLSVFVSERDAAVAGVFTRNRFAGAPVERGRRVVGSGLLRAVVVNSKVSNVGNGARGIEDAERMAAAAGAALGVAAERVLVALTGVIGVRLPIEKIEAGLLGIAEELVDDPLVGAEGMMTTDTHPKALSLSLGPATISIVAKGAGMIAPNMATMLAYVFTDAALDATELDPMLRSAVRDSFNMLSIDTDTSTSDMCVLMANGLAGRVDADAFAGALRSLCVRMAEIMARDGEGATKLVRVRVTGALADAGARLVARTVVDSPLVKTMAYGADPNVGRLLMAVGKCVDVEYEPEAVGARINGIEVIRGGRRLDFDEATVRAALARDPIDIERVSLGSGPAAATAFGCDLTEGYIRENASYSSS